MMGKAPHLQAFASFANFYRTPTIPSTGNFRLSLPILTLGY
jgi:hypothetical protein